MTAAQRQSTCQRPPLNGNSGQLLMDDGLALTGWISTETEWASGTCTFTCAAPRRGRAMDIACMPPSQGQGPAGSPPPPAQHYAPAEPLRRNISRWRVGSNLSRRQCRPLYLVTRRWCKSTCAGLACTGRQDSLGQVHQHQHQHRLGQSRMCMTPEALSTAKYLSVTWDRG